MLTEQPLCIGLCDCHGNPKHAYDVIVYQGLILGYREWLPVIECFFSWAEETPLMINDF